MTTSSSLLALPNELLALIIESDDLTIKDLANLRRTCKHTKYFASSAWGRCAFDDLDVCSDRDGFNCLFHLLLSDLGTHLRAVCLTWWPESSGKCDLIKHYDQEVEIKHEFCHLQNIDFERCEAPARLWKTLICAATHLKTFNFNDQDSNWASPNWLAVYGYTFGTVDTLLGSIGSDCLSSLELTHIRVSISILKRLLDIHKNTLSTLDIEECMLVDGSWFEILNCIRLDLSNSRVLRINVCHEAIKKIPPPAEYNHRQRPWDNKSYLERSPYAVKTYSSPLKLKLEGQKEIINGLSELLKAPEGYQAQ